jgi:hypothetical protein
VATTRGRLVRINQTIIDQADFFEPDGYTRTTGLTITDLTSQVFYNNLLQSWPLVDGSTVSDSQVTTGFLYFHEIAGSAGNYSVRFRPNSSGYWRTILYYVVGTQILAQDYDVTAEPIQVSGGLKANFSKC